MRVFRALLVIGVVAEEDENLLLQVQKISQERTTTAAAPSMYKVGCSQIGEYGAFDAQECCGVGYELISSEAGCKAAFNIVKGQADVKEVVAQERVANATAGDDMEAAWALRAARAHRVVPGCFLATIGRRRGVFVRFNTGVPREDAELIGRKTLCTRANEQAASYTGKLVSSNKRCSNYKVNRQWTRSWKWGVTLEACAKMCSEAGSCNLFSYGTEGGKLVCFYNAPSQCKEETFTGYNTYKPERAMPASSTAAPPAASTAAPPAASTAAPPASSTAAPPPHASGTAEYGNWQATPGWHDVGQGQCLTANTPYQVIAPFTFHFVQSLNECKDLCLQTAACTGFSHNGIGSTAQHLNRQGERCRLHTVPIIADSCCDSDSTCHKLG